MLHFLCSRSYFVHVRPIFSVLLTFKKVKGRPYSITERRVPELIPVLGSQPAGDFINPAVGYHYFPPGLQLPPYIRLKSTANFF